MNDEIFARVKAFVAKHSRIAAKNRLADRHEREMNVCKV